MGVGSLGQVGIGWSSAWIETCYQALCSELSHVSENIIFPGLAC